MKKVLVGCAVVLVVGFLCTVAAVGGLAVVGLISESGGGEGAWSTPAAVLPTLTPAGSTMASPVPTAAVATLPPPTATPARPSAAFTPQITPLASKIPYRAVVQIVAETESEGGNLRPVWSGSGTIVDPRGFILTNAHVALPEPGEGPVTLEILVTQAEDQPPVPKYFAEVVQADSDLDIAVLRITTDLNGQPVDAWNLNLPYARLGDSDKLHLGQPIVILGYPGIGGNTITLTRGEVSGFTAEKPYGRRAFIKTSAAIAGGNSGGMAVNGAGELIAIPTQLGSGAANGEVVDCRYLADTNGDGVIDENDDCVPTGGFINALRPINLAKPLIAAALRGEVAVHGGENAPTPAPPPAEVTPWPTGKVLLRDDFSNPNSGWPRSSSEDSSVDYRDGMYRIYVQAKNWETWASAGLDVEDAIVEVDVTKVSGDDASDFGVLCRYQDQDHAYQFAIGADGYYQIFRWEPDTEKMLLGSGEWLSSDAIRQGHATNHLRVECVGDTLALYVNGVLLGVVHDDTYTHGDIALAAGTYDHGGTDVRFDNLVVYAPKR